MLGNKIEHLKTFNKIDYFLLIMFGRETARKLCIS